MNKPPKFDPTIDMNRLDEEWRDQPRLYYEWASHLAEARRDAAEAANSLKATEADLKSAIRNNPVAYGLGEKPTVDAINAAVVAQPDYTLAAKEVLDADYAVDLIGAAVKALDHRKKALENLVDLHGQSYFSTPRVKRPDPAAEVDAPAAVRRKRVRQREAEDDN